MCEYENLEALFCKAGIKIEMICNLTFTFSTKHENRGFHVLFLKMTAEKWPGGCIPTCSDCIL